MSKRLLNLVGLISVCVLLMISVYLEHFAGFVPCPLCTLQRLCFAFLGFLFLLGFIFQNSIMMRITTSSLAVLFSLLGLFLSGRQIWLQRFMQNANVECGASINYMIKIMPAHEVLKKILEGSAECTQPGWTFFHLDMAEWSFLWFIFFLALSFFLLLSKKIR